MHIYIFFFRCCRNDCPSFESAKLLSNLPLQDVISIMRSDNFNYDILQYCFTVSTQITVEVCNLCFQFNITKI